MFVCYTQYGFGSRLASEKRREVRKVKSREAARCRRGKESEVFSELIDALPVSDASKSGLDKTSIIRLGLSYMKLRDAFSGEFRVPHPSSSSKVSSSMVLCLSMYLYQ